MMLESYDLKELDGAHFARLKSFNVYKLSGLSVTLSLLVFMGIIIVTGPWPQLAKVLLVLPIVGISYCLKHLYQLFRFSYTLHQMKFKQLGLSNKWFIALYIPLFDIITNIILLYRRGPNDYTSKFDKNLGTNIDPKSSRVGRLSFFIRYLLFSVAAMLIFLISLYAGELLKYIFVRYELAYPEHTVNTVIGFTYILSLGLSFILILRNIIYRLHDLDLSGFYSLLCFIPFLSLPLMGALLFAPGTANSNRFGPPVVDLRESKRSI